MIRITKSRNRKQYAESKYRRTKSWQSNPKYDNFLACSSMSDLIFLKQKREKDINYFRQHHNLGNPNAFDEYKILQQTYKMICEELENRYKDVTSESNQFMSNIDSSYIEGDDGNVYLHEDDSEEEEDYVDYDKCNDVVKYDWKEWCKKKGLDNSDDDK